MRVHTLDALDSDLSIYEVHNYKKAHNQLSDNHQVRQHHTHKSCEEVATIDQHKTFRGSIDNRKNQCIGEEAGDHNQIKINPPIKWKKHKQTPK